MSRNVPGLALQCIYAKYSNNKSTGSRTSTQCPSSMLNCSVEVPESSSNHLLSKTLHERICQQKPMPYTNKYYKQSVHTCITSEIHTVYMTQHFIISGSFLPKANHNLSKRLLLHALYFSVNFPCPQSLHIGQSSTFDFENHFSLTLPFLTFHHVIFHRRIQEASYLQIIAVLELQHNKIGTHIPAHPSIPKSDPHSDPYCADIDNRSQYLKHL